MNAHRLWRIVISYRAFLSSVSILSVGRSVGRCGNMTNANAMLTFTLAMQCSLSAGLSFTLFFFSFIRDSIRLVHVQKENTKKVKEAKKKRKKNNDADGNEIKNVEFNREKKYHYSLADGTSCISVSISITETTLFVQSFFDVELVCWK